MKWDFPIVFYDGDCGFCNRSVQFILDHEKKSGLHFCALQSETAKNFFESHHLPQPDLSTVVFWNGKKHFTESSAALSMIRYLSFPFQFLRICWLIPPFLRNAAYRFVAKRRHKIATGSCALPTPAQKKRFITQ